MRKPTLVAAVAVMAGCRSPTQITVAVSADDTVCTAKLATEVSVGSLAEIVAGRPPATTRMGCSGGSVGSVVLIPSGGDGDEIAFRVLASIDGTTDCETNFGPECIQATRALRYLPHVPLTVDVPLRSSCEGVACTDATQTCVNGTCVASTLDPTQCEGSGCGEGSLGPASPVGDASVDATLAEAGAEAGVSPESDASSDASADAADASTSDAAAIAPPSIALALGFEHSCALLLNDAVKCWGTDAFGELGIGDAGTKSSPFPPTAVVNLPAAITTIASGQGAHHVCALANDGGVYCWGANEYGQLGINTGGAASGVPVTVEGAPPVSALALGDYLTCGTAGDASQVNCWGDWVTQTTPGSAIQGTVAPIVSITAGQQVGCEATGDAGVFCWGDDVPLVGVTGAGNVDPIPGTAGIVAVSVGSQFECGLRGDGSVACWGTNDSGELGFASDGGDQVYPPTPIVLPTGRHALQLASGAAHVCALLDDGTAACWGQNDAHQCGSNAAGAEQDTPALVPGVTHATSIAAGTNHTCAVLSGTSVVCWGANDEGQLVGTSGLNTGVPQTVDLGP